MTVKPVCGDVQQSAVTDLDVVQTNGQFVIKDILFIFLVLSSCNIESIVSHERKYVFLTRSVCAARASVALTRCVCVCQCGACCVIGTDWRGKRLRCVLV
jgi:hypothetical protein